MNTIDCTVAEFEEMKEQAVSDFKLLLRNFFKDHPFIKTMYIQKGRGIYYSSSTVIHKDDWKENFKAYTD